MDISALVSKQHAHFRSGATLPVSARLDALDRLRRNILAMQPDIEAALQADLGKHPYESYFCSAPTCAAGPSPGPYTPP